jgi:hypothetical protein
MNFCQLHQAFVPFQNDYPVDVKSNIPQHLRGNNKNDQMPQSPANGGLYNAPQSNGPHASIPVVPTSTNYVHYNLRSANPPPGAINQFIGTNRLGNNYTAMPNVYWLNNKDKEMDNKYNIKVVHDTY